MSIVGDVLVNLFSAGVGGGAVATYGRLKRDRRYRLHNAFWEFLERPTIFVVGGLESVVLMNTLYEGLERLDVGDRERSKLVHGIIEHVQTQEDSGLIGRGDFDAMVNMVVLLSSLKVGSKPVIMHPDEVGDRRTQNLVLIGGGDVNSLTEDLSRRLKCSFVATRDERNHNLVRDLRLEKNYPVRTVATPTGPGDAVQEDFGVLVKARNPENSENVVLILAGAQGYGTLAAAEACVQKEHLEEIDRATSDHKDSFESLISYKRIIGGSSDGQSTVRTEFFRRLGR